MSLQEDFEKWVKATYTGQAMDEFPADWDKENEFFYKIGDLQYRVKAADIPERLKQKINS